MRVSSVVLVVSLASFFGTASVLAQAPASSVGIGQGQLVEPADSLCGQLLINSDQSYEDAYCWSYGGVRPPEWGAFAECQSGDVEVCSVVLDLTTNQDLDGTLDVFVWEDAGGVPGSVVCLRSDVDPRPVAHWPSVSRHLIALNEPCCVSGDWWVGTWTYNPICAWWVGADLNGPGGCPMTKIHPGIGYPSGWQDVSVVWGPTSALGIGADVRPCEPTPATGTTWGRVKSFYR